MCEGKVQGMTLKCSPPRLLLGPKSRPLIVLIAGLARAGVQLLQLLKLAPEQNHPASTTFLDGLLFVPCCIVQGTYVPLY